jgi:hypothetical protein
MWEALTSSRNLAGSVSSRECERKRVDKTVLRKRLPLISFKYLVEHS